MTRAATAILALVGTLLAAWGGAWAGEQNASTHIIVPGVGVGDFTLGMTKGSVLQKLGEPKAIHFGEGEVVHHGEEKYALNKLPRRHIMAFRDIDFWINGDSVEGICVLSPRYKLSNGLRVGDSYQKFTQAVGDTMDRLNVQDKEFVCYYAKGLGFAVQEKNQTVDRIAVFQAQRGYRSSDPPPQVESLPVARTARHSDGQTRTYEVSVPEAWQAHVAMGNLTIEGDPFYGVSTKSFGICPELEIRWSLENLTDQPMCLKVNFRSPNPKGRGQTGFGVWYLLQPRQQRFIHDIVPVWSAIVPVSLRVNIEQLYLPNRALALAPQHCGVATDLVPLPEERRPRSTSVFGEDQGCHVRDARLASSPTEKNALEFVLENVTDREVELGIQVSVGDPVKADWGSQEVSPLTKSAGSFAELEVSVNPSHPTVVRIPFSIPPDAGQTPLLVFRIFQRLDRPSPDLAERLRLEEWAISSLCCGNLVYAGSIDLHEAASTGKVLLPQHVPAAERSKLTVEKRSKHFVFRYRPDSFAEGNIERIIQEREAAYDKLHAMLQMDVPVTVTIDLYTDMEAKALGSRTEWTPHNTLNNRHIAEVCNDSCECNASHELAHIFTYHMGGATGGLCEPFAVYCENDTDIANATERVRRKLKQGSLKPLEETLSIPSDETIAFIDYLLTGHLSKFKRFYVQTTKVTNWDELNTASQEIYGMDLETLERCWRTSVRDAPR